MATPKTPAAPSYEPDREYAVLLAKPVQLFGQQLLPLHQHIMQGRIISKIVEENSADAIASAASLGD
jgi:hypothetical protein